MYHISKSYDATYSHIKKLANQYPSRHFKDATTIQWTLGQDPAAASLSADLILLNN
jgi:hypothetical protein